MPSGYSELGVICEIALNANSNVTNTHTVRGTVTRSVNGTTYIQRVNQTNGELESIALLNSGTYTPGNVLDISGGVLNNSNGVPYLDVTNASLVMNPHLMIPSLILSITLSMTIPILIPNMWN